MDVQAIAGSPWAGKFVLILGVLLLVHTFFEQLDIMRAQREAVSWVVAATVASRHGVLGSTLSSQNTVLTISNSTIDLAWYPPNATQINNLTSAINATGVYGFIYNNSYPTDTPYGTYNWCNMPHVRSQEYPRASDEYKLQYVELIHRHHKRTVYASNSFPVESYGWDCDDAQLFYYGQPTVGNVSADGYWNIYQSAVNPFVPSGFIGSCQFPQLTAEGLDDSHQHGLDLYGVYHDLLDFLPDNLSTNLSFRVTNNQITSQVAGMVINGMYDTKASTPFKVQPTGVDSLEPQYTCTAASGIFTDEEGTNANWTAHLTDSQPLYDILDNISGVSPTDSGFHASWDHYYDNLSARQCHGKPLPCKLVDGVNSTTCVSQDNANAVYRLGNWEYSYMYRDAPQSLAASTGSYGVWVAELVRNIRDRIEGKSEVFYRHNVAHDGSVSRLLGILQVDVMVWPGMGSEVVFEVFEKDSEYFLRVLWGGQILRSSSPMLGLMDMVPLDTAFAYFDGLVGVDASLITKQCNASTS